ncbi:MAG: C40 family peptidase [Deltaproteobacteria bacterium]|nr:C40 family peptidase [Deltaproteobacteria bacterium]
MARQIPLTWFIRALLALFLIGPSPARAALPSDQLVRMLRSIDGLTEAEIGQFSNALLNAFAKEVAEGKSMSAEFVDIVKSVVETGRFNEVEPERVASCAYKVYQARQMGSPETELIDLSEVLFVQPDVGLPELMAASKALNLFRLSTVPEEIYMEVVYHALERYWRPQELEQVSQGLIYAVRNGLTPRRIALALIIRVDQGLGDVPPPKMVEEEIDYVRSLEPHLWRGGDRAEGSTLSAWELQEKRRQEAAYQGMDRAIAAEVPEQVAQELAYVALERNWSIPEMQSVFEGMIRGQGIGLTPEKLAIAMIIRVDQGLKDVPPATMVDQEIAFVSGIEADKLATLKKARAEADARGEQELLESRRLREDAERKAEEERRLQLQLDRLRQEQEQKKIEAELQQVQEGKRRQEEEQDRIRIQQELEAKRQLELVEARRRQEEAERKGLEELEKQQEAERLRLAEERRIREEEQKKRVEEQNRQEEERKKKEDERIQAARVLEQQEKRIREQIEQIRADKERVAIEAQTARSKAMISVKLKPFAAQQGKAVGAASAQLIRTSVKTFIDPPPSTPYRWGGTSRKGVDCSGFTQIVFKEQEIRIPRVSGEQASVGRPIATEKLKFGDLVFFNKTGRGKISHVGMYYGNGTFAHSSCSQGVTISKFFDNTYFWKRYVRATRITDIQ